MTEKKQVLLFGVIIIAVGIYCLCAAVFNWNWFFNNRRARGLVNIFGRSGARIFYALLGLFFAGIGTYVMIEKLVL